MQHRRFKQVDVFTATPLAGNPVAVVLDAEGIDDATMHRFAGWTNLSETTFVLPPTTSAADYRLRIFHPRAELAFAGHPTLGSAHAVLEAGIVAPRDGVLRQECGAGILPIRVDGTRFAVRVPEAKVVRDASVDADTLAGALGCPIAGTPLPIDVGPVWLIAEIADEARVRGLVPDIAAIDRLSRPRGLTGVTVFAVPAQPGAPVVVRSFAPAAGVPEDPVCGTGNAAVGAYLGVTGRITATGPAFRASQGREVGRDGRVDVTVSDGGRTVEIAGTSVTVIDGHVTGLETSTARRAS